MNNMKQFLIILFLLVGKVGISQTVNSENYKTTLTGTWTLNFCDSLWNILDWICADTLTFRNNGQVNEVRTCHPPIEYLDESDDSENIRILRFKEVWTRYDSKNRRMYYKTYQEWDNTWSEETIHFRVIHISKNEIKGESDAYAEGSDKKEIFRVLYTRVD